MRLWTELDRADATFEEQRDEQERIREQREEVRQSVYDKLLGLRRMLAGITDKSSVKAAWLKGELPRNWLRLEHVARYAVQSLRQMKKKPAARWVGFDPAVSAKALEREHKALKAANRGVMKAHKQGQQLGDTRRHLLKSYQDRFVRITGELTELYRQAGLDDAVRVTQPSRKYPGRTQAEIRQLGKAKSTKASKASRAGAKTS